MTEYNMYNNSMVLCLPDEFEKMNADEIETLYGKTLFDYSFADRTKEAYVNIRVNSFHLEANGIEKRIVDYYRLYSAFVTNATMGELQLLDCKDHVFGLLTFRSNTLSREIFNFVVVSHLNNNELFMILTCDLNEIVNYYQKFIQIVKQIRFIQKNNE